LSVLWGRAFEGEGAPAFWPWVQVIRGLVDTATPSELTLQLGTAGAAKAQPPSLSELFAGERWRSSRAETSTSPAVGGRRHPRADVDGDAAGVLTYQLALARVAR
jgi:hypothetical protein